MSNPVPRDKRWTRHSPCPVCGDYQPNCNGYEGTNPDYVFCTSSRYAGGLERGDQGQYRHWLRGPCNCGTTHGFVDPVSFAEKKMVMQDTTQTYEQTFDYGDGCYVDRFLTNIIDKNGKKKKKFVQYKVVGGKKVYEGFKKLYPAPEYRVWGKSLIYVEGEKQVDALVERGFAAFCFVGGSGGWTEEAAALYCQELKGHHIYIWPDNDEAGAHLAEQMCQSFKAAGIKHSVLNELTVGLPQTGDVIDWLAIPGNTPEKIIAVLEAHRPPQTFFDIDEYHLIPKVTWLLEPLFIERGLTLTVGESEVGKSFITIHYGLRIATELGRPVIYLGLESFSQYPERVLAWLSHYGGDAKGKFFLSSYELQLLDYASVSGFIEQVRDRGIEPAMVIIDTYHAATVGADEISGQDTGVIIEALKRIRKELNTNVNCIHHLNASGMRERGHTSLKAAMDTMIVLKADGDGVTIECGKQRTARHFEDRAVNWQVVENCRVAIETGQAPKVDFSRANPSDQKLLRLLGSELHRVSGLRFSEIVEFLTIPKSTIIKSLKKCKKAGWVMGGDTTPNVITNDGLIIIGFDAGPIDDY